MSPYTMFMMLSSLALGTMITLSSYHWLLAWMGLEINTLAIIPLMTRPGHPRATEAATKYFLTQASASALILFAALMNAWEMGEWDIKNISNMSANMLTIALTMKLGLAPLHFWLPEVLQGLELYTGLIMSTWQKLAPMAMIYLVSNSLNSYLLVIMSILSTLVGGWGGMNQTQLRKIMAYSSIAHLGWMMIIIIFLPNLTLLNFSIYVIMTASMFMMMKIFNTTKMTSMATSWSKSPPLAVMTIITLLSMGGLPPMTGFLPKWLILYELTKQNITITATIMAFAALLSLFFYLRLTYTLYLTQSPSSSNTSTIWRYKFHQPTMPVMLLMSMSTMFLPLTPLLMTL
uniref:NADH-ubiquinone oxidoreductase chain 2 n=1 Tax=Scolecomorphus vittatus TaxID=261001 RepID=Q64JQ7_SCOVT|nr:NADH dehydrogenase subunit 2 [Scolecomorphus vittatus]AAS13732.1 NADH dehydrogenase subunit 2 [Scolecomorphus vittatus]